MRHSNCVFASIAAIKANRRPLVCQPHRRTRGIRSGPGRVDGKTRSRRGGPARLRSPRGPPLCPGEVTARACAAEVTFSPKRAGQFATASHASHPAEGFTTFGVETWADAMDSATCQTTQQSADVKETTKRRHAGWRVKTASLVSPPRSLEMMAGASATEPAMDVDESWGFARLMVFCERLRFRKATRLLTTRGQSKALELYYPLSSGQGYM